MKLQRKRTVLAVDDDRVNLMILVQNLEEVGYAVKTCNSGEQAWDYLSNHAGEIDIVLLDKMMPGMNGIELLKRIKNVANLRHLPVIVQTGDVGMRQMCEGLESGALHYLIKPFHPDVLKAIMQTADNECMLREELLAQMTTYQGQLARMQQEGDFVLRTHTEARLLAASLSQTTSRSEHVARGLMELFANAIEHGNLEIGYETKCNWLASGRWIQELTDRAVDAAYCNRVVHVHVTKMPSALHVSIRDEGKGFDWHSHLSASTPSNSQKAQGHGLSVAVSLLDDVRYFGAGNEVHCNISLPAQGKILPLMTMAVQSPPPSSKGNIL